MCVGFLGFACVMLAGVNLNVNVNVMVMVMVIGVVNCFWFRYLLCVSKVRLRPELLVLMLFFPQLRACSSPINADYSTPLDSLCYETDP